VSTSTRTAGARRRPYVQIPNDLVDRMADAGLDAAAIGLSLAAWSESSRDTLDGRIPARRLRRLVGWTAQRQRDLVQTGFWGDAAGGIQLAEYLEFNRTRAEIEDIAAKRAEAGGKGGRTRVERAAHRADDQIDAFPRAGDAEQTSSQHATDVDPTSIDRSGRAYPVSEALGTRNGRQAPSKLLAPTATSTATSTDRGDYIPSDTPVAGASLRELRLAHSTPGSLARPGPGYEDESDPHERTAPSVTRSLNHGARRSSAVSERPRTIAQ
jgi:hypothetical protein